MNIGIHKKIIASTVIGLTLAVSGLGYYISLHAKEFSIANDHIATPRPTRIGPTIDVLAKIDQATKLLESSPALQQDHGHRQIALALLNTVTGDIFEKRFWINDSNLKSTGIVTLEPIDDGTTTIDVSIKWWNSFNSFYEVSDHPELMVIGNKFSIESKYLGKLPERQKTQYSDIVYIPYSTALQTPEVIQAGKAYVEQIIASAYSKLDANHVMSHYAPDATITHEIPKELVRSILLIEHIDPSQFAVADDNGVDLAERVLTIIGANKDRVFRYTGSPAGATGLAQFIEPTYRAMVAEYPSADLIKDYGLGMADHVNAAEAMVLFFDSHSQAIAQGISNDSVSKQLGINEDMLAAAYNGGPGRVVSSIKKYGLAWMYGQINTTNGNTIFRQETIDYIKKFQAIRQIFTDQSP